jgi:pilus assembly protein FimV
VNKRHIAVSVALALALGSGSSWGLGLGQLQVKSGLNQPLVAEIPIIASAPGELENLEVRLASPEAFERVGLIRPTHTTANLSFSVGKNARGQSVVLVTSSGKFVEPFLSFLIEADWGKGVVTKEYTALIDPPYIAKAVIRPLEAPQVAIAPTQTAPEPAPLPMETTIKLTPEPEPVPAPAPVVAAAPETASAPPAAVPPAEPEASQTAPTPVAATPEAAPAPTPVMASPEAAPAPAEAIELAPEKQYGPVASGETLSKIASKLNPDADNVSIRQMMMALLKANPDAFVNDNVNQLKRGAVMRIPGSDEAKTLSDQEASALIAEQSAAWNASRAPVLQPTETVTQTSPEPAPQPEIAASAPEPVVSKAPEISSPKPVAQQKPAPNRSTPRLEITPPAKKTVVSRTVQSGAASGAGGTELRAELTQAREDVAIRDTQINELKSRVTDLEDQQNKRQQLIDLQNSQLKALQDELAKRNSETSPAVPAPETAAAAPAAMKPVAAGDKPPPSAAATSEPAWYLNPLLHYAAGGVLLLGGLIWLFRRRSEPKEEGVIGGRRISDDADFQASLAAMKSPEVPAGAINTSVQPAFDEMQEAAAVLSTEKAIAEDPEWTKLSSHLRSKPQDLDAHLAVLRFHYKADDAAAFEAAAKAMQAQVSTVLDPRWREAVVMGGIILPSNPMFNQSDWNAPRFTDSHASASAAVKPALANDIAQVGAASAVSLSTAKPEVNTVTPIEDIGPFTEDYPETMLEASSAAGTDGPELDLDDGAEADLMVSDPSSSTKIELASAYLDIGDVEGARSMLEEVVESGSAPAKRLAKRLLKEIG